MTWKDRAIAKSEAITDAWEVVKAYAGRAAEWVLFGCMVANIIGILPGVHLWDWVQNLVMGTQVIALDVGGFGLASLANHARRAGDEQAAKTASITSWFLIGLMILTVTLVAIGVLWPSCKPTVDLIDKGLILVRVAMTVVYSHVIHKLRTSQEQVEQTAQDEHARALTDLQETRRLLSSEQQTVSSLREHLSSERQRVDTLSGQLRASQQEVNTLREQVDSERQRVSSLREERDGEQGELTTLRRKLDEAVSEVERLRGQVDGKQLELEAARALANTEREQASRLRQLLEAEQARMSSLRDELRASQQEVNTLRVQVDGGQGGQTQRVDGGRTRRLDSGQVDSGHDVVDGERVIRLDTTRLRKGGQEAADTAIAEKIRHLLISEPGLSGRAIAQRVGCSPTTAAKWKTFFEENGTECVNE